MATILDRWGVSPQLLTEVVESNPSLRGMLLGYLAEYKLREMWFSRDSRITDVRKYDDHDRAAKGDIEFLYRGKQIRIECKSLQSGSIRREAGVWIGKAQCDASDRRTVVLPDQSTVETTCLRVAEFDLLAVNLFAFEEQWRFVFAKNADLPRTRYHKYTPYQRQHLLATLVQVTWPPQHPFRAEPFSLLDELVA